MQLLKVLPIIMIVFVGGCVAQVSETDQQEEQTPTSTPQEQPTEAPQQSIGQSTLQGEVTSQEQPPSLPATHTINIISTGFTPKTLTIKSGDIVTFVNKDVAPHWPASDIHPTHCEYKGCGVFDAKKGLAPGEPYSIVFDLAGNWKYHDHLNPGLTGMIVVQ